MKGLAISSSSAQAAGFGSGSLTGALGGNLPVNAIALGSVKDLAAEVDQKDKEKEDKEKKKDAEEGKSSRRLNILVGMTSHLPSETCRSRNRCFANDLKLLFLWCQVFLISFEFVLLSPLYFEVLVACHIIRRCLLPSSECLALLHHCPSNTLTLPTPIDPLLLPRPPGSEDAAADGGAKKQEVWWRRDENTMTELDKHRNALSCPTSLASESCLQLQSYPAFPKL